MSTTVLEQYADSLPPRKGACIALTIDTTARAYSLASLAFGGHTPNGANDAPVCVNLQLHAETADVFIHFASNNTVTLDKTAAVAAGGTLAFANTYGQRIPAGSTVPVRIRRHVDTYIHVQGSAAGILRINAFSGAL